VDARWDLRAIDGEPIDSAALEGRALMVVNVASRCGLTPQYEGLERLQRSYGGAQFTVLGVPCNQFGGQEPGGAEEIQAFCVATYATSFPLTEKLDVNGRRQHPLYAWLTSAPDGDGRAGEVEWNFEKFLVSPDRQLATRFRSAVEPQDERIIGAIEALLGE
jgi:glutathione peroxidase